MVKPRATRNTPATEPFDFVFGRYHLSNWCVPYFTTTMTLRQAANSLKRVDEFPGVEHLSWRIEELYQRDLDWPRVERQILPYLRATDQPQFFNSLTVGLLPLETDNVATSFEGDSWHPPEFSNQSDFERILTVGPISIGYYEGWETTDDPGAKLGKVCWNPREIFSVAIDGQHRLAAIKQLALESGNTGTDIDNTQVPIILLILDPRLGYKAGADQQLVDVLRMLFITLNKHAVSVKRSRQILLDDKDPHSLCVRALVGNRIIDGSSDCDNKDVPRLPLTLVDWHSDQAKFDKGPYVTTILLLDWVVSRILGAKPLRDYMDYREIRRQIKSLRGALSIGLNDAIVRLDSQENIDQQPFSYSDRPESNELAEIQEAFGRVWAPVVVKILTEFLPYRTLIEERKALETLSTEFVTWYYLFQRKEQERFAGEASRQYGNFIQRLGARNTDPIGPKDLPNKLTDIEEIKELDPNQGNLAFNVVFQRALFIAFMDFVKISELHLDEILPEEEEEEEDYDEVLDADDESEDETLIVDEEEDGDDQGEGSAVAAKAEAVLKRAEQFVDAMNAFVTSEPAVLGKDCPYPQGETERAFWRGSILTAEGNIDFTMSASGRAREIIFWIGVLHLWRQKSDELCSNGFDAFWEHLEDSEFRIIKALKRSILRFSKDERSSPASRILASRGEDYSNAIASEEVRSRLEWIWHAFDDGSEE